MEFLTYHTFNSRKPKLPEAIAFSYPQLCPSGNNEYLRCRQHYLDMLDHQQSFPKIHNQIQYYSRKPVSLQSVLSHQCLKKKRKKKGKHPLDEKKNPIHLIFFFFFLFCFLFLIDKQEYIRRVNQNEGSMPQVHGRYTKDA